MKFLVDKSKAVMKSIGKKEIKNKVSSKFCLSCIKEFSDSSSVPKNIR